MQAITTSARGLSIIFIIAKDRVLGLTAVGGALLLGTWLGTLGLY